MIYKWLFILYSYYKTIKNVDKENLRVYIERFWGIQIQNLKSIKLEFEIFFKRLFQNSKIKET